MRPALAYAVAPRSAASGSYFYNTWDRALSSAPAVKDQGTSLGWEIDFGVTFQWDEYFQFNFDNGIYFPGQFYAFSNTAQDNTRSAVFATSVRVGVNF